MADKALSIAKSSLRTCYDKKGIVAGKTHFNYYWARDSFYASWGALELNDCDIVKKNLELFLKNIDKKGQVPLRVGASSLSQYMSLSGIRRSNSLKPHYSQDKGRTPAIDPNLLLLITIDRYLEKTNDLAFARKNIAKLHLVVDWLETFEKEGLIYAGKYATWQDMVKKKGFVLYTNVLYFQALLSLSGILKRLAVNNEFSEKAQIIKENINKKFYNKKRGFYTDFFNEKQKSKVFSSDGNFFAVLFGIADQKKALSILRKAENLGISKDVPSYTNYPKHGGAEVFLPFYLLGMHDYNDYGVCWPWIGCLHSMALSKAGQKKQAKEILEKISRLVMKDNDVYETYEKNGKPLKRIFYSSEHPFSWGAGFYILAEKLVKNEH